MAKEEEKVEEAWMVSIDEVSERGEGSEIGSDFVDDLFEDSKSTCCFPIPRDSPKTITMMMILHLLNPYLIPMTTTISSLANHHLFP